MSDANIPKNETECLLMLADLTDSSGRKPDRRDFEEEPRRVKGESGRFYAALKAAVEALYLK